VHRPGKEGVLADDSWAELFTSTGRCGLTLLFWTHARPYGEVHLDLAARLECGRNQQPAVGVSPEQVSQ
jgi:hypothetical protein